MKKLLTILTICGMVFSAYADENENKSGTENEERQSSNEKEEPTPPPPPTKVTNELEENDSPTDLLERIEELEDELDALEASKVAVMNVLIKQRNEVLEDLIDTKEDLDDIKGELEDTRADLSDTKEDLDAATHEIKSLLQDRINLHQDMAQMEAVFDRGPGSLFRGWVYSLELKWVYVSPTIVPYSFSQNDGWMLYEYGTNPRRVYYYKTKEWRLLDNVDENESKNER